MNFRAAKLKVVFASFFAISSASIAQVGGVGETEQPVQLSDKAAGNLLVCSMAYRDFFARSGKFTDPKILSEARTSSESLETMMSQYSVGSATAEKYASVVEKYESQISKAPTKLQAVVSSCNNYVDTFPE